MFLLIKGNFEFQAEDGMIVLISGGQRSGKSQRAEELLASLSDDPLYIATARVQDEEMAERVKAHREHRPLNWETIDVDLKIGEFEATDRVVLLDCVTLWLTNLFMDQEEEDKEAILSFAREQLDKLFEQQEAVILVSQELGMGITPTDRMSRNFVDVHGKVNQYIAERADRAYLMVSGLPLTLKGPEWA